uniref:Hexosyltransferase n=1 Tax=Salvator merianae TaxID=96440 RepID=A0A8D0EDX6_SALMN
MMPSKKFKKMLVLTVVLVSAALCLFVNIASEICIFCQMKGEIVSFKSYSGVFLKLPHIDCSKDPPFLIILVTSAHDQAKARMAIRETWGKEKLVANKRIVTYFLMGMTWGHAVEDSLQDESLKYGDIMQKDFIDAYYNLTLKTMMGIEWIHKFCPQSSFVMKTDSDMFVNTNYLVKLLLKRNRNSNFVTGFLKPNERPIRNIFSKWYVSKWEYPGDTYPPFCSGTGYVFSTDVASQIHNIFVEVPFVKLEDVFIGLCLAKLKIKLEELHSKQTFFPDRVDFSPCRFKEIVASHFVRPHEILTYWKELEKSENKKCPNS